MTNFPSSYDRGQKFPELPREKSVSELIKKFQQKIDTENEKTNGVGLEKINRANSPPPSRRISGKFLPKDAQEVTKTQEQWKVTAEDPAHTVMEVIKQFEKVNSDFQEEVIKDVEIFKSQTQSFEIGETSPKPQANVVEEIDSEETDYLLSIEDIMRMDELGAGKEIEKYEAEVAEKARKDSEAKKAESANLLFRNFAKHLKDLEDGTKKLKMSIDEKGEIKFETKEKSKVEQIFEKHLPTIYNLFKGKRSKEANEALDTIYRQIQHAINQGITTYTDQDMKEHDLTQLGLKYFDNGQSRIFRRNRGPAASFTFQHDKDVISKLNQIKNHHSQVYELIHKEFQTLIEHYTESAAKQFTHNLNQASKQATINTQKKDFSTRVNPGLKEVDQSEPNLYVKLQAESEKILQAPTFSQKDAEKFEKKVRNEVARIHFINDKAIEADVLALKNSYFTAKYLTLKSNFSTNEAETFILELKKEIFKNDPEVKNEIAKVKTININAYNNLRETFFALLEKTPFDTQSAEALKESAKNLNQTAEQVKNLSTINVEDLKLNDLELNEKSVNGLFPRLNEVRNNQISFNANMKELQSVFLNLKNEGSLSDEDHKIYNDLLKDLIEGSSKMISTLVDLNKMTPPTNLDEKKHIVKQQLKAFYKAFNQEDIQSYYEVFKKFIPQHNALKDKIKNLIRMNPKAEAINHAFINKHSQNIDEFLIFPVQLPPRFDLFTNDIMKLVPESDVLKALQQNQIVLKSSLAEINALTPK